MKPHITLMVFFCVVLTAGAVCVSQAAAKTDDKDKPCLGIKVDSNPLPELLVKHLRLEKNQGLLIVNVLEGSPADRVGLERDDIVSMIEKDPVTNYETFVDTICRAGVDGQIALEVIHLGQRRTVSVILGRWPDEPKWKYPQRTEMYRREPRRLYQMPPGQKNWRQIPYQQIPDLNHFFRNFYQQKHFYQSPDGKLELEISIDGDPADDDTKITVRDQKEKTDYHTTIKEIDQLPEKYRDVVRETVESARQSGGGFSFPLDDDKLFIRPHDDDFHEQMRELQRQMEKIPFHRFEPAPDVNRDNDLEYM